MVAQFQQFKAAFGRSYESTSEEDYRMSVFSSNVARMQRLQAADSSAVFGITKFMDLTAQEFKDQYLNYRPAGAFADHIAPSPVLPPSTQASGFDWRLKGAVTAVKDQGQCGSCWAFSAVEEMESMWFLAGNTLTELSPQQVVSCDKGAGDLGCNGGDTVVAYKYMQKSGLQSEASYPYTSGDTGRDGNCKFDASKVVAKMTNWTYSTPACFDSCNKQDENVLQTSLENVGPVSICVAADSWQFYSGGILSSNCPHAYSALNHCTQLVGWNVNTAGVKYWMIRNSWNTDWGVEGYINIKFGSNLCGLADEATHIHC